MPRTTHLLQYAAVGLIAMVCLSACSVTGTATFGTGHTVLHDTGHGAPGHGTILPPDVTGGTDKPQRTQADIDAESAQRLMMIGAGLLIAGVIIFGLRFKFPRLIPTYAPIAFIVAGAGCIAWATLQPAQRFWIIIGAAAIFGGQWWYSNKHNQKLEDTPVDADLS